MVLKPGPCRQGTPSASSDVRERLVKRAQQQFASACALLLLWPATFHASEPPPMTYIAIGPESATDVRHEYTWEMLRAALECTTAAYGPYRLQAAEAMAVDRQAHELRQATGKLTTMYMDTRPAFERDLIGVHIPIDKGLVSYRVLLIRRQRRDDFSSISTLDDLRRFSFGLGVGWIDTAIMRHNGFTIVTGSNYEGLFEMLENQRFDVFLRSAMEVLDEVQRRQTAMPDLYIEDTICLYYPLPLYFWFAKNETGRQLAARLEDGLWMMIGNGTFDRIFDRYQRHNIEVLQLAKRKLLKLENPFIGPETQLQDKRLWLDLQTYAPVEESP